MNVGEQLKLMYSADPATKKAIKVAVKEWPFGYCEYTDTPNVNDESDWLVTIDAQEDLESTKTIIDAYMHVRCGFSMFDIDEYDIRSWLANGQQFCSATVRGSYKELAHNLWGTIIEMTIQQQKRGMEIESILVTVVGKEISLDDIDLFLCVAGGAGKNTIGNTCLFADESMENYIQVHFSLAPEEKTDEMDLPLFLRKP